MNPEIPSFSATIAHLDGNAVVVLLGELDMDSAPDLQHVLEELIAGGPPEIVLDLSSLDFMDSRKEIEAGRPGPPPRCRPQFRLILGR